MGDLPVKKKSFFETSFSLFSNPIIIDFFHRISIQTVYSPPNHHNTNGTKKGGLFSTRGAGRNHGFSTAGPAALPSCPHCYGMVLLLPPPWCLLMRVCPNCETSLQASYSASRWAVLRIHPNGATCFFMSSRRSMSLAHPMCQWHISRT